MYQALVTDLDGTAIRISSDGSDIDAATKQAVQLAIQKGKKLTCATGREWELTEGVVRQLGFVSPCIIEGGTRIIDPLTGQTLWEKPLDDGVPGELLTIFKQVSPNRGFVMHSLATRRVPLASVDVMPPQLRFLYLNAVDQQTAQQLCNHINARGDAVAHVTPSWDGNGLLDVHVTHPAATKQHAIQKWQELEGVTQAQTIGMGDSSNDIPIFLSAGLKVAVGNATPDLQALADYIAPAVTDGALRHVIQTKLLAKA